MPRPSSASRESAARIQRAARRKEAAANLEEARQWTREKEERRCSDVAQAAAHGQESKLRWLLLRAVILQTTELTVEWQDRHGMTALHSAIDSGQLGCARQLLKHGARINIADRHGRQPLHLACAHGNLEAVTLLLDRATADSAVADAAAPASAGTAVPATTRGSGHGTRAHTSVLAPGWSESRRASPATAKALTSARDRAGRRAACQPHPLPPSPLGSRPPQSSRARTTDSRFPCCSPSCPPIGAARRSHMRASCARSPGRTTTRATRRAAPSRTPHCHRFPRPAKALSLTSFRP